MATKLVGNVSGQANDYSVATGSGAVDDNTQRVTLATDQPVVPVSDNAGTLTVDAPVATPVFVRLSDGSAAIATLPVAIATAPVLVAGSAVIGKVGIDQTTPGTTNLVALAANQSVNVAQMNGVTVTMGNGASGTGVQRVTIASDSVLTVSTSVDVSLASAATSAQLLAANTARRGLLLTNTDANGVYLYYGTTATATKFTVLIPAAGYWEMPNPIYTGRIDVIWAADGAGSLIGSEL